MNENEIGDIVIDCAIKMYRRLGPGLLDSVYESVLCYELQNRNLSIERQVAIPIVYDNKLGYLLNFGAPLMKDGITRIINGTLQ